MDDLSTKFFLGHPVHGILVLCLSSTKYGIVIVINGAALEHVTVILVLCL